MFDPRSVPRLAGPCLLAIAVLCCSDRASVSDDDDTSPTADDDDATAADDDDSKPPADDDTASDDDSGDDDSGGDDDSDCPPLGPGVTPTIVVNVPGWQLRHFAGGFDTPTGLALDTSEDLLFGAGLGGSDSLPVHRLTQALVSTASDPIPDPDGVAVDSTDRVFAAGSDRIWLVETLMGGAADTVWHTLGGGGNINDLALDAVHGDLVYVALDDGRVIRVDAAHAETELIGVGDSMELAVDPTGDLWALGSTSGELYRVDHLTGSVTLEVSWADLAPGYLLTNRLAYGPHDGALYGSAYFTGLGGTVARWDPATPGVLELWVEQLIDDDNPEDLGWGAQCLYVLAPLDGNILQLCPCG